MTSELIICLLLIELNKTNAGLLWAYLYIKIIWTKAEMQMSLSVWFAYCFTEDILGYEIFCDEIFLKSLLYVDIGF